MTSTDQQSDPRTDQQEGPPTDARPERSSHRREIVSYVRRSDRLSPAQQKWWDRHHDDWVLEVPRGDGQFSLAAEHRIRPAEVFGRTAPLIVEIGPGMGDSLVAMAAERPADDVLAFEVYQPAVARILAKLSRAGVGNVRIVQADAVPGLQALDADSLAEVWMFFPDPWHKLKHRKRRLVTTEFADLVASRLRPGGRWRLATDWADYATQMHRVLDDHPRFVVDDHHRGDRPETKFERRGLAAGRAITDLSYRRR